MTKKEKKAPEPPKIRPEFANLEKSKTIVKNSNDIILKGLRKLKMKFKLEEDFVRQQYYHKAIESLESYPNWIEKFDQVENLPGIGAAIKKKINEVLDYGRFREVELKYTDEQLAGIDEIGSVHGISWEKALRLYDAGYPDVASLKKNGQGELNQQQKLALKYFDELR